MDVQAVQGGRAARRVGMLIFTIGIVLLAVVFSLAIITFRQLPQMMADDRVSPQGIIRGLTVAAVRGGFLLVMAYVSSLLASKGLDLYSASKAGR